MTSSGGEEGYDDDKKYEDLQEKVLSYLCRGLSPTEVQESIQEEYSVALSLQHITNLNSVLVANRDNQVFANCALFLKKEYGAVSDLLDSPACLFYQDETMKSTFARFPDIIFLAVSRTFCKQTIITVACQDSFGKIEVIAAGILNGEDKSTFSWFLEVFKQENKSSKQIRVVVLATNVSRFKVVRQAMPAAYLFIHDPLAAFANDVRGLDVNFSEKEVKSILYKFQDLMYTDSKKDYDREVMELRNIAHKEAFALFMQSWDPFEIHWVYGSQNNVAKFLSRAGKAFSSVMNMIGSLGQKQFTGLIEFVKAYHACVVKVRETRAEAVKSMVASFDDIILRHASHAVSQRVYKHLTPVAADAVLEQYNKSMSARVQNIFYKGDCQECECPFFKVLNLPCIHMFIKRRKEMLELFDESECNKLWTWRYCQQSKSSTNIPKRVGKQTRVTKKAKSQVKESNDQGEDNLAMGDESEDPLENTELIQGDKEAQEEVEGEDNVDDSPSINGDGSTSQDVDLQVAPTDDDSSDDEMMVAENLEDSWSSNEGLSEEESDEAIEEKLTANPKKKPVKAKAGPKSATKLPAKISEPLYQHFTVALDITACLATVLSRSDYGIFEERIGDLLAILKKWEKTEDDDVLKSFDIADFQKAYEGACVDQISFDSSNLKKTHQYIETLHKNFAQALRVTSRIAKFLSRSNPSIFKQRLADLLEVLRKWRKSEDAIRDSGAQKNMSRSSDKTLANSAPRTAAKNTGTKEFGLRTRKVVAKLFDEEPEPPSRKRRDNLDFIPKETKRRKTEGKLSSPKAKTNLVQKVLKQSHLSELSTRQKEQLLAGPSIELQIVSLDSVKAEEEPELKEKLEMCGWMVS